MRVFIQGGFIMLPHRNTVPPTLHDIPFTGIDCPYSEAISPSPILDIQKPGVSSVAVLTQSAINSLGSKSSIKSALASPFFTHTHTSTSVLVALGTVSA